MNWQIEDIIEALKNLRHLDPATEDDVVRAEKRLGVQFADEYRAYVKKYGAISAKGVELTGVTTARRLNVADVTLSERERNSMFPEDMYVVENIAIDGILMLQNMAGEIFELIPHSEPVKKYDDLSGYLKANYEHDKELAMECQATLWPA